VPGKVAKSLIRIVRPRFQKILVVRNNFAAFGNNSGDTKCRIQNQGGENNADEHCFAGRFPFGSLGGGSLIGGNSGLFGGSSTGGFAGGGGSGGSAGSSTGDFWDQWGGSSTGGLSCNVVSFTGSYLTYSSSM